MISLLRECLLWIGLNVVLPGGAALLNFIFTMITAQSLTVDQLLGKAFAGGENCVVAGVLFASIYFETQRAGGASTDKLAGMLAGLGSLIFAFLSFAMYGAFKLAHLVDPGPIHRLPEVHHTGALTSVGLLSVACVLALYARIRVYTDTVRKNNA
jgi:hypothetical protein